MPLKVQGMWSVAYFGEIRKRHMAFKKKYPDRTEKEVAGVPCEGIENLRPETIGKPSAILAFSRAFGQPPISLKIPRT